MKRISAPRAPGLFLLTALVLLAAAPLAPVQEESLLSAMHAISSHTLIAYVNELSAEKYHGRLTGTPEYKASAEWLADRLRGFHVSGGGTDGSYFQAFANPYTLVLPGSQLVLNIPAGKGGEVAKSYQLESEYFPGATSDSGQATAEVVYVGYGVTAPEMDYDDYRHLDVKGKFVLVEVEVPVSPDRNPELFKKWRPYSFHQYKIQNARDHGAAGMIYHYHIANPNADFIPGFLLVYVGDAVALDLFAGTGRNYRRTVEAIRTELRPRSFATGKKMTIVAKTEHHAEGVSLNVLGRIEGSDPALKAECIVLGAHLDHVGQNPELMPGANDNASGVAVLLGVAEALDHLPGVARRTILFAFFGAEEQGVKGSEYFLGHPPLPREAIKALINLDGVGRGEKLTALAGKNFPRLWGAVEEANRRYVHREVTPLSWANIARQRLDAAHFMWAGIPVISFASSGAPPLPFSTYHTSQDRPEHLTPEIMEDLAQLIFLTTVELANGKEL